MKHLGFVSTMVALVFLMVVLELTVSDYRSTLNKEHRSVIKRDSTLNYYENIAIEADSSYVYHKEVSRKNELYYENLFQQIIYQNTEQKKSTHK